MARFYPLFLGELIEAPDRKQAELVAYQRHGAKVVRVISHLDLEQDRAEEQAAKRRRPPEEDA